MYQFFFILVILFIFLLSLYGHQMFNLPWGLLIYQTLTSCQQTIIDPMATNFVLTILHINPLLFPPNVPLTLHMFSNIVPPYRPPSFQIVSFLTTMMPPPSILIKHHIIPPILHKLGYRIKHHLTLIQITTFILIIICIFIKCFPKHVVNNSSYEI